MRNTKDKAQNQWPEILTKLDVDSSILDGRHHPSPVNGGTDGFRFIDKHGDGWFVNNNEFGDGFALLKLLYGWDFKKAASEVDACMGWSGEDYKPPSKQELAALKAQRIEAAKEREKVLQKQHADAASASLKVLNSSTPASDDNPYLKRKRVKVHSIRQQGDDLIIPVHIDGELSSIQRINPDGSKWFQKGSATAGGYHSIGKLDGRIFIAEGYATGATVHEATGAAVVVAFNAGNLEPVAKKLRAKYPDIEIVITGDNDASNVGEKKGKAAAAAVYGKFIAPTFSDNESGTDWNDWAAIHGLDAVRGEIERKIATADPEVPETESKPVSAKAPEPATKKPSQAASLVAIVQDQQAAGAELFHDQSGIAYASVDINGIQKTLPVRGRDYRNLLRRDLYRQDGRNASSQAIDDALGTIEGQALFDGKEIEVEMRVAGNPADAIWIDLGNESWQSVKVTSDGWDVVAKPSVKWRRPPGMRALPVPVHGGSWKKLFEIFPLPEDAQKLVIGWLLMAFNPCGPYPPLIEQGEQGTGKSMLEKLLRGLADPNAAPIRSAPRNEHDLVIAAQNGWVVALDNLSGMRPWLSDGLCRIATGGGFAARELYSNGDEHIIEATRPIIINGIDDMAARPDLADRAIILNLEHIEKGKVRTERELMAEYEAARPEIIGSLLDAVSMAMKMLPQTHLNELPRMADFALWVTAAESALWESGAFMKVYGKARKDVVAAGLDGSPVAQAVIALMLSRDAWHGNATALLEALDGTVDEKTRHLKIWPKTARGLSNVIRRLAPALRADGLDIEFQHSHGRKIIITKTVQQDNTCISSSPSSHRPKPIQDKACSGDATGTQGRNGDASENPSSRRKPLVNNSLGRRVAGDAKKQALSCSGDDALFDDPEPWQATI